MNELDVLIAETQSSYIEYINKISAGCLEIARLIDNGEVQAALYAIADLSEGLDWLITVENDMKHYSFVIDSNIAGAINLFSDIVGYIEQQNYKAIKEIMNTEMQLLFSHTNQLKFKQIIT